MFEILADNTMKMSEDIRTDMLLSYKKCLEDSIRKKYDIRKDLAENFFKYDHDRTCLKDMRDNLLTTLSEIQYYHKEDQGKKHYEKELKETIRKRDSIIQAVDTKMASVNSQAQKFNKTVSTAKKTMSMVYSEDILNINDSIMKYFVYQTSCMKNQEYDSNTVIKSIESYVTTKQPNNPNICKTPAGSIRTKSNSMFDEGPLKATEFKNDYLISSLEKIQAKEITEKEHMDYIIDFTNKADTTGFDMKMKTTWKSWMNLMNLGDDDSPKLPKKVSGSSKLNLNPNLNQGNLGKKMIAGDIDEHPNQQVCMNNLMVSNNNNITININNYNIGGFAEGGSTNKRNVGVIPTSHSNAKSENSRKFSENLDMSLTSEKTGYELNSQSQYKDGLINFNKQGRSSEYILPRNERPIPVLSKTQVKTRHLSPSKQPQNDQNLLIQSSFQQDQQKPRESPTGILINLIQKILSNIECDSVTSKDLDEILMGSQTYDLIVLRQFFDTIYGRTSNQKLSTQNFDSLLQITYYLLQIGTKANNWILIVKLIRSLQGIGVRRFKKEETGIFENIFSVFRQNKSQSEAKIERPNLNLDFIGCHIREQKELKDKQFWIRCFGAIIQLDEKSQQKNTKILKDLLKGNFDMMMYCLDDVDKCKGIMKQIQQVNEFSLSCFTGGYENNELMNFMQETVMGFDNETLKKRKDNPMFHMVITIPEILYKK